MKEASALIDQFVSESLRVKAVFFEENKEAEVLFRVPSRVTARIQETHILLGRIICELVDRELFPEIYPKD